MESAAQEPTPEAVTSVKVEEAVLVLTVMVIVPLTTTPLSVTAE